MLLRFSNSLRLGQSSLKILAFCATLGTMHLACAQDTPLLSGGMAFLTSTTAGKTSYLPIIEPLMAAPIGPRLLFESRALLLESFYPNGQGGYGHTHYVGLTYMQGDFIANPHLTVIAGSFIVPFGTYNERLSPVWINNFQDGPLVVSLGLQGTGTGVGGQLRGSAIKTSKYSIDYTTWFSARSGNEYFNSDRSAGGRSSLYLPAQRLELGVSYDRSLQGKQENFTGVHVWWEPKDEGLRIRSEYARGQHAQGYWVEADYRTSAFGGLNSWVGRFEPLFRMQQSFRRDNLASDGLPPVNVQKADFGLDYNLPHDTRILTSYSRQFAATGNENIWETGIVYRFLIPAWKGKVQ
jgi:hypothetical protein